MVKNGILVLLAILAILYFVDSNNKEVEKPKPSITPRGGIELDPMTTFQE